MATLTPAYGRDYKSAAAAIKDLIEGKDFVLHDITSRWDGSYCTISDFNPGDKLTIRYSDNRKCTIYNVK